MVKRLLGGRAQGQTRLETGGTASTEISEQFEGSTLRRMAETPTTTTSQKSIAIHLPFVLQYASNLYCSAFGPPRL